MSGDSKEEQWPAMCGGKRRGELARRVTGVNFHLQGGTEVQHCWSPVREGARSSRWSLRSRWGLSEEG